MFFVYDFFVEYRFGFRYGNVDGMFRCFNFRDCICFMDLESFRCGFCKKCIKKIEDMRSNLVLLVLEEVNLCKVGIILVEGMIRRLYLFFFYVAVMLLFVFFIGFLFVVVLEFLFDIVNCYIRRIREVDDYYVGCVVKYFVFVR